MKRVVDVIRSERQKWSRTAFALWMIAACLLVLYVSLRSGVHSPENILPSAD